MKTLGLSLIAVAATLAPLVACGGGGDNNDGGSDVTVPDARVPDGASTPDSSTLPAGCDYAEQNDTGNGANAAGAVEQTQLTVTTRTTICGKLNNGHFTAATTAGSDGTIDIDAYTVTLPADSKILMTFGAAGLNTATAGAEVDYLIFDSTGKVVGGNVTRIGGADHIVDAPVLDAGDYTLLMGNFGAADTAAAIDYKAVIAVENTRPCAAGAGTPTYAEANDGSTSNLNNVLASKTTVTPVPGMDPTVTTSYTLTAATTDAAEPSGISLTPTTNAKITGTSAGVDPDPTDDYYDGDTYEFTTDANTTQMRVNMSWPTTSPKADIDLYLFEKPSGDTLGRPLATAATVANPEYNAFAVKPGTTYYLFIGGYHDPGSTMAPVRPPGTVTTDGLPRTYTVQVCGDTFTP